MSEPPTEIPEADLECDHVWISNSGRGGEPVFRENQQMWSEPKMHVSCRDCSAYTWFSEEDWYALQEDGA